MRLTATEKRWIAEQKRVTERFHQALIEYQQFHEEGLEGFKKKRRRNTKVK